MVRPLGVLLLRHEGLAVLLNVVEMVVSAGHAVRPEDILQHLKLRGVHKALADLGEPELLEGTHLEELLRFLQ